MIVLHYVDQFQGKTSADKHTTIKEHSLCDAVSNTLSTASNQRLKDGWLQDGRVVVLCMRVVLSMRRTRVSLRTTDPAKDIVEMVTRKYRIRF